jgi:hypothetical protein
MHNTRGAIDRSLLSAAALGVATTLLSACSGSPTSTAIPNAATGTAIRARTAAAAAFTFVTLNNNADPTFNQLLGINNHEQIAGYYGSGAPGHPNKGYVLVPPYKQSDYVNENYPGSAQTQVVAITDAYNTAGFWIDANGINRGFIRWHGAFTSYSSPHGGNSNVLQILGLNDSGIGVGFYNAGGPATYGFTLNRQTGVFGGANPPGCLNATAAGINDAGDVTGFCMGMGPVGFLRLGGSNVYTFFAFPGAVATTPFGINDSDEIVGSYVDSANVTHGFLLKNPFKPTPTWVSIDDPNAVGMTVVNGINDKTHMVGFYMDALGNTNGILIK